MKNTKIPGPDEIIHIDLDKPRTKREYFDEVFKESIRYNLQKTAFLKEVYTDLVK